MSANNTETCLRSPGDPLGRAAFASADPHESQKRLPTRLVAPHAGQPLVARSAPQDAQNRAPTRFAEEQAGQLLSAGLKTDPLWLW
jgi:hypothetical protein